MLELPEVMTVAGQMDAELRGKRIVQVVAAGTSHKFAFFNHPPDTYPSLLCDRTLSAVTHDGGSWISATIDPDAVLLLGEIGGRVLLSPNLAAIPTRHQLLLGFADGSALTVTITLWAAIQVMPLAGHTGPQYFRNRLSPLSPEFTLERFDQLLTDAEAPSRLSVKAFMISNPGFAGIGNGCLQDILFRARLHPRRPVSTLVDRERQALFVAVQETLALMIKQGGRDTERDLYNQPGGYHGILDSRSNGKPCPRCGTPIEKISFLGGASYFCPVCQGNQ